MPGALMSLVAYGSQDLYLSGNPQQYYIFKIYYKRHNINDIVDKIEIIQIKFVDFVNINQTIQFKNMFDIGLVSINCSKNLGNPKRKSKFNKLPAFRNFEKFNKLKFFDCSRCNLKSIEKLKYTRIVWLNCSYNHIVNLPKNMFELEYLDFSNNNCLYRDLSFNGNLNFTNYFALRYLICNSSCITNVIGLPQTLIYLDISNNPLTYLPDLPTNLEYLLLTDTRLHTDKNFKNLTKLKYLDISLHP